MFGPFATTPFRAAVSGRSSQGPAMDSTRGPTAVLVLAGKQCEVQVSTDDRRGALRLLTREAEERFGVVKGTYVFHDERGRQVTSMPGLLQAMTLAREGRFVLEVRETDAGKAQRQMQVMLTEVEQRIAAKVDSAVELVRKEISSIGRDKTSESDMCAFLNDMRAKLNGMVAEALTLQLPNTVGLEALFLLVTATETLNKSAQDLEQELSSAMDQLAAEAFSQADQDMETCRTEVKNLEARVTALPRPEPSKAAGDTPRSTDLLAMPVSPPQVTVPLQVPAPRGSPWLQASDMPRAFSYSSKLGVNKALWSPANAGGVASFAHGVRPRGLERVAGARSMPALPPLAA